ncbi:Glycine betaine/carnitine transport binding protein GbuC precursor [Paraliobacillus sp. PM-2]|uniref:glycine betaine ABC transporter substrate-binding protein n=1 Tax=Paraliobacillus sp. PM-2 TaxID=1462524 RepID=UPI00061BD409|nr:glycine betaine ABC transporter substrate-binding protein [Paraliobacillus sp. PM-2]CQR47041.1 Glycine betaine/carnitine transport binding protein GbuC precursor [Paraliobacillus sp. PM-2]
MLKKCKPFILFGLVVLVISIIAACGSKNDEGQTEEVGKAIDYTITGIEPGAGITTLTEKALEDYSNLEGYSLEESSTAAMLTSLDEAIDKEEPIVVTGWTPHWKFAKYDLKFLEDPEGSFGKAENINTITRLGLEEDMPEAYTVLDRFYWEVEDMESVMLMTQEKDMSFKEAADQWIEENEDKVAEWTEGIDKVDGQEIELVSTPWDTERASTSVVANVLTSLGYEVTDTPVDPAVMFQAVATNDADASVAPWLPETHGSFYEEYKGKVTDLGPNLEGAKLGLVVPAYMEIDSIEDLKPNK